MKTAVGLSRPGRHAGRSARGRAKLLKEELHVLMGGYIRTHEKLYCDILQYKVCTCGPA
jgi:hypothetical protein